MRIGLLVTTILALTGCSLGGPGSPTVATSPSPTPLPGPAVFELGFFWDPGTTPCLAPTNMNLHFVVQGAKQNDPVIVSFSGPALPPQENVPLPANLTIAQKFPIPKGSGAWTATVTSVAGKAPHTVTGGHLTEQSSASC